MRTNAAVRQPPRIHGFTPWNAVIASSGLSAAAQRAKAEATKQSISPRARCGMDCFAEPVIGRAFARGAANRELLRLARKRNLEIRVRQNNATGKSVKTCPALG
jgi:hypothetical protein